MTETDPTTTPGIASTLSTIAANALRRLFRDRTNIVMMLGLPLLLIVILGSAVASFEARIGVVVEQPDELSDALVERLEQAERVGIREFRDRDDAEDLLEKEELTAMVVLPESYGEQLRRGEQVTLEFLSIPDGSGFELRGIVEAAVTEQNLRLRSAALASERLAVTTDDALAAAASTAAELERSRVEVVEADDTEFVELSGFDQVASQELVLFMFITSITAAAALIHARRLGVIRRMMSTPATAAHVLFGQMLGRYAVALTQGLFIVVATAILFGVDWGSWPASLAVVALFALVATAAAMLVGALATNENQSVAIGMSLGLALAALGGCMVPLEVFPDGLRTVAHITPHAWAVDAFATVVGEGGGLADIATELGVLALFAAGLLALATGVLRRAIIA